MVAHRPGPLEHTHSCALARPCEAKVTASIAALSAPANRRAKRILDIPSAPYNEKTSSPFDLFHQYDTGLQASYEEPFLTSVVVADS